MSFGHIIIGDSIVPKLLTSTTLMEILDALLLEVLFVFSPNDSNSLFLVFISCLLGISLGPYPCFTVLVPAPTKRFFGARGADAKSVCLDAKMAAAFIVETGFAKANSTSANSTSAGVSSIDFKVFFFLTLPLPLDFMG